MPVTAPDAARASLRDAVLDELAAHSPAAAMRYMRHRPGGGLSLVHLNVLTVLDLDGTLPMRALAESLDVSQASATGIVERQRDEADRRVIRVALTDEGRGLIAGLAAERRDHLARILDRLTVTELDGLLLGTRALRRAREQGHSAETGTGTATGAGAAQ